MSDDESIIGACMGKRYTDVLMRILRNLNSSIIYAHIQHIRAPQAPCLIRGHSDLLFRW